MSKRLPAKFHVWHATIFRAVAVEQPQQALTAGAADA